jgi:threonine/homoserine/homoserine lactone efflux protein
MIFADSSRRSGLRNGNSMLMVRSDPINDSLSDELRRSAIKVCPRKRRMNQLSDFLFFGLFGALAVGPALMNLYLATIESSKIPAGELVGYLAGELLYFAVALFAFQFSWVRGEIVRLVLELISGTVLVFFSAYGILRLGQVRAASRQAGFLRSILLVLLNPNILLIDLTLVAEAFALSHESQYSALCLYAMGVFGGTAAVVALVRWNQRLFARWRKTLEVLASFFFLVIGLRLLADVVSVHF